MDSTTKLLSDTMDMTVERNQRLCVRCAPLSDGSGEMGRAKNAIGSVTNSNVIAEAVQHKCDKSHEHADLLDRLARTASMQLDPRCDAACRGLPLQT